MTRAAASASVFLLPENPDYTIRASALDAARYTLAATVKAEVGLNAQSFLTDIRGKPVRAGSRLLQGIGYCADAPFGARVLERLGRFTGDAAATETARGIAHHCVHAGYLDDPDVPLRLYRDSETGELFDHLEARNVYFDVGHMAKAMENLLALRPLVDVAGGERIERAAERFVAFVLQCPRTSSGWLPRRVDHRMAAYSHARKPPQIGADARGGVDLEDSVAASSGAGMLTLSFLMRRDRSGAVGTDDFVREACDAFVDAGGYFGSVNTDTEDPEESVAFALAFQILLDAASVFGVERYRDFAYEVCLAGLERFKITSDLNGQRTRGLLRLSDSYSSACFWECSEAALAYLRAAADRRSTSDALSGLTILRAIARNHYGSLGFIPSELDWDGRMPPAAHLEPGPHGPRAVTHPYMNNLHVVWTTLYYLESLAWQAEREGVRVFIDAQGNRL